MTEQELSNAMNTYGDTVYRLALCRLQNAADAEDVYQDVFLRLLEQRAIHWDGELWDAVARLPEKLRTAVHLFYGEGYESGEIGALLGIPAATVRSRLRRARTELRDLLGGFDDEESVSRADRSHPYARRAE